MLNVDPSHRIEFYVEVPSSKDSKSERTPYSFSVSPESIKNITSRNRHKIPPYLFEGKLDSVYCNINEPFSGEVVVRKTSQGIK